MSGHSHIFSGFVIAASVELDQKVLDLIGGTAKLSELSCELEQKLYVGLTGVEKNRFGLRTEDLDLGVRYRREESIEAEALGMSVFHEGAGDTTEGACLEALKHCSRLDGMGTVSLPPPAGIVMLIVVQCWDVTAVLEHAVCAGRWDVSGVAVAHPLDSLLGVMGLSRQLEIVNRDPQASRRGLGSPLLRACAQGAQAFGDQGVPGENDAVLRLIEKIMRPSAGDEDERDDDDAF